ncbi:RNA-directed DNA polymerase (Reverse transcriptase) [Trifolium medium]|uniref:RNA-directed DNA polymerase (Reverse transcriptase) n=1 Tax=Trifolium medium TaxID=97028 RepID=A0A392M9M0_9FABA|nr:RNA-directed DNA polymerase (Reverse transcriptase) [Trifolium medium]
MIDAQSLITISVCDVLNTDGEWNLSFLHDNLPANIVNELLSISAPSNVDGYDTMGWGGTSTHSLPFKVLTRCQWRSQDFCGAWAKLRA